MIAGYQLKPFYHLSSWLSNWNPCRGWESSNQSQISSRTITYNLSYDKTDEAEKCIEFDSTATILRWKNICGKYFFAVPFRYFTKLNNEPFYWVWGWLTQSIHQRYWTERYWAQRSKWNLLSLSYHITTDDGFFMENKESKYFCKISAVSTFLTFTEVNVFVHEGLVTWIFLKFHVKYFLLSLSSTIL